MDKNRREITKIVREVNKFTVKTMRQEGIGSSEFDFIHVIRKNPGITQSKACQLLGIDKAAATRMCKSLVNKGYLIRERSVEDQRNQLLYATQKADSLKNSKAYIESLCYEWLLEGLSMEEQNEFSYLLDLVYKRCKEESKNNFANIRLLLEDRQV